MGGGVAGQDDGVYVINGPERTAEQARAAAAALPPSPYQPPADRWTAMPRTAAIVRRGGPLKVLMLGDSIVNDTSRSSWETLLTARGLKVSKTTVVRGSTGCWWYREPERMARWVLPHKPDLLIIGGISHRDDLEAVKEVALRVRRECGSDVLLMTGAFGGLDPWDETRWRPDPAEDPAPWRRQLRGLAAEIRAGILDMTALWGAWVRASGMPVGRFMRDPVHANEAGEQILGRILAAHLTLDPAPARRTSPFGDDPL